MRRNKISQKIQNRLFALSGNKCAFPDCNEEITNSKDDKNISAICHIEALNLGWARYNPSSDDNYRNSFENLILLCPTHHKIIDDLPDKYTVEVLRNMKRVHESKMLNTEVLQKNTSALNTIINIIGRHILEIMQNTETLNAPNIDKKLSYNNVVGYKPIIQEYSIYQGKLNQIYEEIEEQAPCKKDIVLLNIRNLYLKEKGKYTIESIKENADSIIDNIKNELWNIIDKSSNEINLDDEAIEISILIILVDAFMRCNILEDPKDDSK